MSQIIDPIPQGEGDSLLCSYVNATNQIQVARITNVPNWYFERVVFPGQRLVFEAISYGILEIHSGMMASAILSDRIPCNRLAIQENSRMFYSFSDESKSTTGGVAKSSPHQPTQLTQLKHHVPQLKFNVTTI
ncbi:conserved hypothetical protein [Hyella patelloides LEGE 07179]|uniref:DUF1830 domain-containing protein n=1 Tax=Hyella patelloides LEGE 07179 TaxID=945734 RepID=A0A563VMU1_9CYAN|nr:DUF1830 domain-containing protein [Hyella patelloides]VEP12770.1 conserved hypothetical protein [Hyella patelloides LEGE 07179]